jgi:hypothetical protein
MRLPMQRLLEKNEPQGVEEFDNNLPSILKIVGSFETFAATPSIKNSISSLSVSFEVGKNSIDRGEDQNIVVRISNEKSNNAVAGAKVTGELFHPSGEFNTLGERNTDEAPYSAPFNVELKTTYWIIALYSLADLHSIP